MEALNKPTHNELLNYYSTNRKYFDELAKYYYENDKPYYESTIYPIYNTILPGQIICPYCKHSVKVIRSSEISNAGWLLIVFGICTAFFGIIFFPSLIGIIFILIGVSLKKYSSRCPDCKSNLNI